MKAATVFYIVIALAHWQRGGAVQEISDDDVGFYLFTPRNPSKAEKLKRDDVQLLRKSSFNTEWPVRFIIHGYLSDKDSEFNTLLRDAYLKKGNFNVFVVDWSRFTNSLYPEAVNMVEPVGQIVGQFSKFLNEAGVDFDQMYLIGHSLGAHIAGIAGHYITPDQYHTIFALDPARPGFETIQSDRRIHASDAKYVESIQTDASWFGVGLIEPTGHASFFPNFPSLVQPGCDYISCSHLRSFMYFAESINSKVGFYGKQLGSGIEYARMGGEPSEAKQGVYYVGTNAKSPFAKGK